VVVFVGQQEAVSLAAETVVTEQRGAK